MVQVWTAVRKFLGDLVACVLETIRRAQLQACQRGWKKILKKSYAKDIVLRLQHNKGRSLVNSTIANDIKLLNNLFDKCNFVFIPKARKLIG